MATTNGILSAVAQDRRPSRNRLFKQLALSITAFIFLIELIVLGFSHVSKQQELYELRDTLEQDVLSKTGDHWAELHPGILDGPDIERRLNRFTLNYALVTLVISIVVSVGTLLVFHRIAGRYVMRVIDLNSRHDGNKVDRQSLYTDTDLPNNELADLIVTRNDMIESIMRYEEGIEAQLRQARRQIIQSEKLSMVGELTSTMVHDIRNPLAVIVGRTALLKSQSSDSKVRAGLESIEDAAGKITALTTRMGRFSRADAETRQPLRLEDVVENSLDMVGTRLRHQRVAIEVAIDGDIMLLADPIGLEQVFTNLFGNAGDAMRLADRRRLTVRGNRDTDVAVVVVEDTGTGIAPDAIDKVFMAFYTTKEAGNGTGLGLSSCKRIIEQHGGTIAVNSRVGKGTRFTIRLPINLPRPD